MKRKCLAIGIILLLLTTWLSGCPSQGISVHKISGEHPNSVNMTEEQMNRFPHLKEAILTNTSGGEVPREEWDELRGTLEFFDTQVIRYQDKYYEIWFNVAD
jgi:hypothetical protein